MVKMSTTVSVSTYRVFSGQMNEHETLFGGQTLAWLDEAASLAAHRFSRRPLVTAGIDQMAYRNPVHIGDALMYRSVVTGVGTRSLEVFTKLVGEDMDSGRRYLAGYAFTTFVTPAKTPLPPLEADDAEGQRLAAGYAARHAANQARRQQVPDLDLTV